MSVNIRSEQSYVDNERYRITRRVTVVGGVIDLLLGVSKIFVGQVAHSQALVADGVHSLSDLVTDFMVIWAAKHASRAPDAEHPYGHQRIETLGSIVLGILLCAVAVGIAYNAITAILRGDALPTPGATALVVAVISVLSKEWIYHYTMRAARDLQSDLLRSNAWHSRSDALSSIVVIIGLVGTMLGYGYLDAAAAVLVGIMIAWIGGDVIVKGSRELVDTAPDPELVKEVRRAARQVEGVADVHDVRTRRMGSDILLDGHILLAEPRLSVSEGHRISEAVRKKLGAEFRDLNDIIIHIDAEDDAAYQRSAHLPLRSEILDSLHECYVDIDEAKAIQRTVLHYLDGKLRVELWLPLNTFTDLEHARRAAEKLREATMKEARVHSVDVVFV